MCWLQISSLLLQSLLKCRLEVLQARLQGIRHLHSRESSSFEDTQVGYVSAC